MYLKKIIIGCCTILITIMHPVPASAQEEPGKTAVIEKFTGSISVTHNGISLVPNFSLGKPALLFDLKFIHNRFSIEPDMRFALEGKPWAFLFWFRYKAIQTERFSLRVGAHPALNFRDISVVHEGIRKELIQTRRFLAYELVPYYSINDHIGIGAYYLYGYGVDGPEKNTHFLVASSSFRNLAFTRSLQLSISPQAYYLKMDDLEGFYVVANVELAYQNLPLSLTGMINKAIQTEILPEEDFIWSTSLKFRF